MKDRGEGGGVLASARYYCVVRANLKIDGLRASDGVLREHYVQQICAAGKCRHVSITPKQSLSNHVNSVGGRLARHLARRLARRSD